MSYYKETLGTQLCPVAAIHSLDISPTWRVQVNDSAMLVCSSNSSTSHLNVHLAGQLSWLRAEWGADLCFASTSGERVGQNKRTLFIALLWRLLQKHKP